MDLSEFKSWLAKCLISTRQVLGLETRLRTLEGGTFVQVPGDWDAVAPSVARILNKPSTMAPSSHDNTAHSTAYAQDSDLSTHAGLTTTAHGGLLPATAFVGLTKITVSVSDPGGSDGDLWVQLV